MDINEKNKPYPELILLCIGFAIAFIVFVLVFSSILQDKHAEWIEEERAKHSWETDFDILEKTDISCNYKDTKGGYSYTIKGSITNQSGYPVYVSNIFFNFYDDKGNLICCYGMGNVGFINAGETKKYTSISKDYYKAIPVSADWCGVEYSLEIK